MIGALFRGIKRIGRLGVRLGLVVGLFALINRLLRRGSEPDTGPSAPSTGTGTTPRQQGTSSAAPTTTTDLNPQPLPPEAAPPAASETPHTETAGSATATEEAAWVEPEAGTCPVTHPVKAKVASKIFHEPGMLAYDRTTPDRCYRDSATAEADGFRRAKR